MGRTRSGRPWPVQTTVNDLIVVDGYGRIFYEQHRMTPAHAREYADKLIAGAKALRVAADWAEDHDDELQGIETMTTRAHRTHIEGPDSAGHWSWVCTCNEEATGYELAAEVMEAAEDHAPLAADSMIPEDEEEDD